jgi:hypothetical protein
MHPFAIRGVGQAWLASMRPPAFGWIFRHVGIADNAAISDAEVNAYVALMKHGDHGNAFLKIMRGFELTWMIYIAFSLNLIYQFFTHTELIGKLPRLIEFIFNTPSHHRVHHGSDPEYLDKNYAGICIIWDRIFGTFQQEGARPTYGLTKPVNTYNLLKLQYGEYGNIIHDVRTAKGLRDKLGYIFRLPGWQAKGVAAQPVIDSAGEPVVVDSHS